MGNCTLELAHMFLKFWLGVPDFMLTLHFRCLWKRVARVREDGAALWCVRLSCPTGPLSQPRGGWGECGGGPGGAKGGSPGPLQSMRLSCSCRTKHAQNGSVMAPRTPGKIPAQRGTDCAQINIPCSVRGSRHER